MQESQPRWFRVTYRSLAGIVLLGLAGAVLYDIYGFRVWWLGKASALSLAVVPLVFLLVAWIGVGEGYVRWLTASIYTLLYLVAMITMAQFVTID